jgi:hypothetical protein
VAEPIINKYLDNITDSSAVGAIALALCDRGEGKPVQGSKM